MPGLPPFDNEFAFLQLPGECLYFPLSCFDKSLSEEELKECKT
jgi:hypothetical protein